MAEVTTNPDDIEEPSTSLEDRCLNCSEKENCPIKKEIDRLEILGTKIIQEASNATSNQH
jgi:hypothetical protein